MGLKLKEKIAVITGGDSGIGLATAHLFHEEGATVVITARSLETANKARIDTGGKFDVVKVDVRSTQDIEAFTRYIGEKYRRIDVLFANAGIAQFLPTEKIEDTFFDDQFDTNVRGLFFTVSRSLTLLGPGSSVILNASAMSSKGIAKGALYSATKAAVRSFARSWTAEFAHKGIRFNVLSPGPTETPIYEKMGMSKELLSGFFKYIQSQIPLGRLGRPEEMAKVVLFLASADSSYLCGADICADGGYAQI